MKDIDSDFVKYHTDSSLHEQLKIILDEYEQQGYFKDRMKETLIKIDKGGIKKSGIEVKSFFMFIYSRYDHIPKRANINNELDIDLRKKIYKFAYGIEPYRTEFSRAHDMDFIVNKFLTLYSSDEKKELIEIFDKLNNSTTFKDAYNHTKAIFRIGGDELGSYVYYCHIFLPDK